MHSGHRLRAVAIATAALFVATACSISTGTTGPDLAPASQQILRANDGTEPNSFDPTQQIYDYEAAVGRQTFQALLKAKADLSDVQPAGAQSFNISSDGLTYTFHLRANAKWRDGQAVTASDWVYGYQHLLNPALAAGNADPYFDQVIAGGSGYGSVDVTSASAIDSYLAGLGLSASDANTFVIKLAHPAAYFKWVASLWVGIPLRKDVVEKAAGGAFPSSDATKAEMWAGSAATIVGNGAFKISEIVPKDHVTLVPNSFYWGGAPKLQRVTYSYLTDATTIFSQYQTGAIDMIGVPIADVTVVKFDPVLNKQAQLLPELASSWISYNASKAPLDNAMLRLALSKSIDRNLLVDNVEHGLGAPQQTFIPKGMNGYDASDSSQSFDVAAAKADLAASGVAMAQVNALKFLTRNSTGRAAVNTFIVNQWNTNLGTNIQLDVLDSNTVTIRIRKGQYDIYGVDGWISGYPDDQPWFDLFVSGSCHSLNWGCPTLPGYDTLVNQADSELDPTQRAKDYAAAQKMLVDQAVVGFLYQSYSYNLIKPYVGGLTVTPGDDGEVPGDLFLNDAYITAH